MPPGYYVLVQLARILPGDPRITLRLPSILGYILSLLGVYWFARKRLPVSAGLTAALLITLSPFREYALVSRPYSLLVGFLAISAGLWQRIGDKRFATPLFALFLTLAVSCHHLAVVAISGFGAAEFTWSILTRRIRWGVWATFALASCPFFLDLPLILNFREVIGKHFWAPPHWDMVYKTYAFCLGVNWALALVFVVFFAITVGSSLLRMLLTLGDESPERDLFLPEIVLVGGFLFYPALRWKTGIRPTPAHWRSTRRV